MAPKQSDLQQHVAIFDLTSRLCLCLQQPCAGCVAGIVWRWRTTTRMIGNIGCLRHARHALFSARCACMCIRVFPPTAPSACAVLWGLLEHVQLQWLFCKVFINNSRNDKWCSMCTHHEHTITFACHFSKSHVLSRHQTMIFAFN